LQAQAFRVFTFELLRYVKQFVSTFLKQAYKLITRPPQLIFNFFLAGDIRLKADDSKGKTGPVVNDTSFTRDPLDVTRRAVCRR